MNRWMPQENREPFVWNRDVLMRGIVLLSCAFSAGFVLCVFWLMASLPVDPPRSTKPDECAWQLREPRDAYSAELYETCRILKAVNEKDWDEARKLVAQRDQRKRQ